jgi:hypothetical protein
MLKNEIVIDGIRYVGSELIEPSKRKIVRTYSAGVFFGEIESKTDTTIVMLNVRRIWYWEGAASLSQLAMEGTKSPSKCKFPCVENRKELSTWIEILDCTEKALKSLDSVPVWSA